MEYNNEVKRIAEILAKEHIRYTHFAENDIEVEFDWNMLGENSKINLINEKEPAAKIMIAEKDKSFVQAYRMLHASYDVSEIVRKECEAIRIKLGLLNPGK